MSNRSRRCAQVSGTVSREDRRPTAVRVPHADSPSNEDGEWARLIRIDHSLLITELLRADAFNGADPAMLAA